MCIKIIICIKYTAQSLPHYFMLSSPTTVSVVIEVMQRERILCKGESLERDRKWYSTEEKRVQFPSGYFKKPSKNFYACAVT